jgi:hypothetical protein
MTDSTGAQLLSQLQTTFTNYITNLANQRIKGVIISGEALEVRLIYSAGDNIWSVMAIHVKTGLTSGDTYSSYANGLAAYNSIVSS